MVEFELDISIVAVLRVNEPDPLDMIPADEDIIIEDAADDTELFEVRFK